MRDYFTNIIVEEAESINLSPKNKYKQVFSLAASKQAYRDVNNKIQHKYVHIELFQNVLEAVNGIDKATDVD